MACNLEAIDYASVDDTVLVYPGFYEENLIINKQIVLDNIIPGDVTIFNILSGEKDFIVTQDAICEKGYYKIPFTIPSWELSGMFRILPKTGRPLEIKLLSGDILMFPSYFMYPHEVTDCTKGTRYSFVSWAF